MLPYWMRSHATVRRQDSDFRKSLKKVLWRSFQAITSTCSFKVNIITSMSVAKSVSLHPTAVASASAAELRRSFHSLTSSLLVGYSRHISSRLIIFRPDLTSSFKLLDSNMYYRSCRTGSAPICRILFFLKKHSSVNANF
jgi:hypothetical protein